MSESAQYVLRWRGRQSGPFSLEEINRKLDEHEIGMGHQIQIDDNWISLDEFFAGLKQSAPIAQTPQSAAARFSPGKPAELSGAPNPEAAPAVGAVKSAPKQFTLERPPSEATAGATLGATARRRLVYALLGILFGFSGLHNYYARHWMTGLLQLLLSIATLLLGFGIIASWLWAMVEAFVVRKDANGLEML